MSQAQIRTVNNAVLDVLGLADIGHSLSAITVTLHPNTWPSARLELLLHKATGLTERQFVRLVPEGYKDPQPANWLDKACINAMERVQGEIDLISASAKSILARTSLPPLMKIPTFHGIWCLPEGRTHYACANAAAGEAFAPFDAAMKDLELVAARNQYFRPSETLIRLKGLK